MTHPLTPREKVFVSASCDGEYCHCGSPAVRKVGEEIMSDDPRPRRHNLTAYVCARHFAEMMGPAGARSVGYTALASGSGDQLSGNPGILKSGDHAELTRWAKDWPNYSCTSEVVEAVLALIAENAALRGENEHIKVLRHQAIDRARLWEIDAIKWETRATEAERKLAEAVQIMEPFARMADEEGGYREDDRLAWGLNRCDISWGDLRDARNFISKEAERG